ncbi:MAG: excinuclease ABC subunit UvrA [Bacteroidetes bacterium]|nr:excinuclease ABC subunit UvrA [Bacteroidota bacterium]
MQIKGARQNNLKDIDINIPKNQLVVITGVSGSGKSSLAFDTLYAEGQRRYIESLSAYVRQFVGKIEKPEVDYIKGIAPAIAIQQKVNTSNPRSTVGTTTEIYDYLKLLFARAGKTISPKNGEEVKRHTVSDVLTKLHEYSNGTKAQVLAPIILEEGRSLEKELEIILQKGFTRISLKKRLITIEEVLEFLKSDDKTDQFFESFLGKAKVSNELFLLIDRISVNQESQENIERIGDSVQTCFFEGHGECVIEVFGENEESEIHSFSNKFELDGIKFEEPSVNLFTFNNPYGACKTCEGFGTVIGIDEDKVVPDKSLSVYENAVACWKGEKMIEWKDEFIRHAKDFPIHKPYFDLDNQQLDLLWNGNSHVEGINAFFEYLQSNAYKIQYRVLISRYKGKTACPDCKGTRLRKDANYVKIDGVGISDLVLMPIEKLNAFFQNIKLDEYQKGVSKRVTFEITKRLEFLCELGLGYLNLNRDARTLSGGESQRIQLVTSLGSTLTGSMYILDEPSIGMHSKDTERLLKVLKQLRDLRNTVIVVEHDEDVIKQADYLIDMGPLAGSKGGEITFEGDMIALANEGNTLTSKYLKGELVIPVPEKRKVPKYKLEIVQAFKHNLKQVNATIPLHSMVVITGVSGSGKSTLVKEVLVPSLFNKTRSEEGEAKNCLALEGNYKRVKHIEYVDQNPIGRSSRSNPVTYIKAYDSIRSLFANQNVAKSRGYAPAHFSFNVDGGRCDACKGDGYITVEMQFMADLHLKCDECKGSRFKPEILDVKVRNKSITDVLNMTVDDAIDFFDQEKDIQSKLEVLQSVGLGYLGLGQSSNTLSGGEAQRIKLAFYLTEGNRDESILFIFDEPTTGLHFHDIHYLLKAFRKLIDKGHSIVIIEHNLDVIKCADWLIDLGPEGGDKGGKLLYQGAPEGILKVKESHTATYLLEKLKN